MKKTNLNRWSSILMIASLLCIMHSWEMASADETLSKQIYVDLLERPLPGQIRLGTGLDFSVKPTPPVRGSVVIDQSKNAANKTNAQPMIVETLDHVASTSVSTFENSTLMSYSKNLNTRWKETAKFLGFGESMKNQKEDAKEILQQYAVKSWVYECTVEKSESIEWPQILEDRMVDIEHSGNPKEKLLGNLGSHYVQTIEYGFTIAFVAKASLRDSQSVKVLNEDFAAGINIASFSGKGDFSKEKEIRKRIKSSNVDCALILEAGQLVDPTGTPVRVVNSALNKEKFFELLDKIERNEVHIRLTPTRLVAHSLLPLINEAKYPRLLTALTPPPSPVPPLGKFGVPAGTIIAWWPGSILNGTIEPPTGWVICDGKNETPDLRGRFPRGAMSEQEIGGVGGTETHNHKGQTTKSRYDGTTKQHGLAEPQNNDRAYFHVHGINNDSHIPPFLNVIFIMKLPD